MEKEPLEAGDAADAVRRLIEISRRGERLVPFLGSGVSASSGIMMGQDFIGYLATTIRQCIDHGVRPNSVAAVQELREGLWKKRPPQSELEATRRWVAEQAETLLGAPGGDAGIPELATACHAALSARRPYEQTSPFTYDHLLEQGLVSLRDWRTALDFLARLHVREGVIELDDHADQLVIDSFVKQLVEKRAPNFTHKMIAHIATAMNVRLLLTTNFDDLIERSFRALRRELRAVEIPLGAALPPARSLDLGRVLVKLHGGLIQTRNDDSLDARPTVRDVDAFVSYLSPGTVLAPTSGPVWLLVIGYSGSDRRMIDMLKAALRRSPELRVLWIAHTPYDARQARRIFSEPSLSELTGTATLDRLQLFRSERPDLILYEAFQRITRALPAGGLAYRFAYKLPPSSHERGGQDSEPRAEPAGKDRTESPRRPSITETADAVVDHLRSGRDDAPLLFARDGSSLGVMLRKNRRISHSWSLVVAGSGAMRIASTVFERLDQPRNRMWFELQEYSSLGVLLLDIVRTLAIRAGVFQQELLITPDLKLLKDDRRKFEIRLQRLIRRIHVDPQDWVLFLYARDEIGGSAGWPGYSWEPAETGSLILLLQALGNLGFRSLIVPTTASRGARSHEKARVLRETLQWWQPPEDPQRNVMQALRDTLEREPLGLVRSDPGGATATVERILATALPRNETPRQRLRPAEAALAQLERGFPRPEGVDAIELEPLLASSQDDLSTQTMLGEAGDVDTSEAGPRIVRRGGLPYREYIARVLAWIHQPARSKDDKPVRRQKFLYAICLFRQSRHECAFFSEAVFPCPKPFNVTGSDNDELRAELVTGWIRELEALRIVHTRPGGFFWMHRDVRLGLQALLGACQVPYGPEDKQRTPRTPAVERQTCARTHLWIARWYLRSFLASRHTVPFWSNIHHNLECARQSLDDLPRFGPRDAVSIHRYRRHLADLALRDALKALTLGRPHAKYWLTTADARLFKQASRFLTTEIAGKRGVLRRLAEAEGGSHAVARRHLQILRELTTTLIEELEVLNTSVAAECGIGSPGPGSSASEPRSGKRVRVPHRSLTDVRMRHPLPGDDCSWSFEHASYYSLDADSLEFAEQFWPAVDALGLEWIKDPIHKCVRAPWDARDKDEPLKELRSHHLAGQSSWLDEHRMDQPRLLAGIKVMNELAYAFTRRAKILIWLRREWKSRSAAGATTLPEIPQESADGMWLACTWLTHHSNDLSRSLSHEYLGEDARESEKALTLYGLALAGLRRFGEGRRRLSEARSILAMTHNEHGPRNAMIYLRTAEAHTLEARHLYDGSAQPLPRSAADEQRIAASLSAAWLALEDAEANLSGNSHSTLWWGLLYRLRLQVAALLCHVSPRVGDPASCTDRNARMSASQLEELIWNWTICGLTACGNSHYRKVRILSAVLDPALRRREGLLERELQDNSPLHEAIDESMGKGAPAAIQTIAGHLRATYQDWIRETNQLRTADRPAFGTQRGAEAP